MIDYDYLQRSYVKIWLQTIGIMVKIMIKHNKEETEKRQNGDVGTIRCQNEGIVSAEILSWLICQFLCSLNIANTSEGSIQCAV